jgi:hypothetical protein
MTASIDPPTHQGYEYVSSRPVRGLGRAVEALLGLYLLANIALIFPVQHEITLLDRLRTDPGSTHPLCPAEGCWRRSRTTRRGARRGPARGKARPRSTAWGS